MVAGIQERRALRTAQQRRYRANLKVRRENCAPHHWQIEPADGPTSEGYCLNCGAVRQFQNYIVDLDGGQLNRVGGRAIRI